MLSLPQSTLSTSDFSWAISASFSRVSKTRRNCFFAVDEPHSSLLIFDLTCARSSTLKSHSPSLRLSLIAEVMFKMRSPRSLTVGLVVAKRSPILCNTYLWERRRRGWGGQRGRGKEGGRMRECESGARARARMFLCARVYMTCVLWCAAKRGYD